MANAGVPVQVIQMRLGHCDIQSTMIYVQMSSAYVDRAFEAALPRDRNGGVFVTATPGIIWGGCIISIIVVP